MSQVKMKASIRFVAVFVFADGEVYTTKMLMTIISCGR